MGPEHPPRVTEHRSTVNDRAFLTALDQFDGCAGVDLNLCPELPRVDAKPVEPPTPTDRSRIALNVVGFLLMMGLGAAGAALMFQDRVALLLR